MRLLLLLFHLLFIGNTNEEKVVIEFHQLNNRHVELEFIRKYAKEESVTIQAYVCSLEMKQAAYYFNPIKKLNIFNEKRNELNGLLKKEPNNVHLRYLRYFIQSNIPTFLSNNSEISEDKAFLNKYISSKRSSDMLVTFIKKNCYL